MTVLSSACHAIFGPPIFSPKQLRLSKTDWCTVVLYVRAASHVLIHSHFRRCNQSNHSRLQCHGIGNTKNVFFVSICPILPSYPAYPFNSHSTQQQQYSQPACKPQPVAFRKQTWQQQLGSNWIRLPVWPVLLGLKVLNTTHLATCDRSWQSQSSCRYWQPSRHPARVCRKCPGHSSSFAKGLLGKSDRSSTRSEQITFEQF